MARLEEAASASARAFTAPYMAWPEIFACAPAYILRCLMRPFEKLVRKSRENRS
ncbi:hypothetical protein AWU68_1910 [Corynebacterium simulans]|uniref:Uncharacterized protein n=1 Tax=Corynebacterium simulans TaxID=146827 RepID=A0ABR5V7C1_9CORY|nr:hypothetical protein WM42_1876 [Corynebacterium simulans]AMO92175.1 hypothetical protein AWU68_1910 [Corynebacterium simulans]KXU17419.1 hypothetical protein WM41_1945 [Corynebacterium simulans]